MAEESAWFKSSYSNDTGGSCIEIAALTPESAWFKSSYSNDSGGVCVEVATLTTHVGIRDSKDKQGPALVVPATTWTNFITFATGPASA
ncbi:DUF397 domain-containing protein [Streptomyces sp. NPDC020965]|uniref:DUF397 domain-containing protein n=1 Tax=Streptomyces sp. NPDC020965 TaxID=3365105 RepID=UPI0037AA2627